MGIRIADGANLLRTATPTSMGSNITTMGVLFRKALSMPLITSVARLANRGLAIHAFARNVASGCSAPVTSMPLPMIISAQMVMSASWPKPVRKASVRRISPSTSYG